MDAAREHGAARRIAANSVLRAGGETVAKVASLAFFVVMARELGEQRFGDFNFALSLATVLIAASGFGTNGLLAREVARDRGLVDDYMSNVNAVKVLTSLGLFAAMVVIVNLGGYDGDTRLAVYLVGAGVVVENYAKTWHSTMQAYERLGLVSVSLIVQRVATAAAGITLMLGGAGLVTVSAVFLGGALAGLATAVASLRIAVVRPRRMVDRARWLPLVKAGVPIGMVSLLFTVLLQIDATLLSFLTGGDNAEVGVYSAAFRFVAAFFFLSWVFGAAVQPWFARQEDDRSLSLARAYELGLKVLTAVLLPLGVGCAVLAEPLIDVLYGSDYAEAVLPLRLLSAVLVLYGISQLTSVLLISRYRPGEFHRVLVLVVAQNLGCNLLLIPLLEADGAALSAAISAVLLGALSLRSGSRITGHLDLARAFAGPLLAGAAMAATLLLLSPPLGAAIALGALVYAVVLVPWERAVNRADFDVVRATLGWRLRPPRVREEPDPIA
jgi:O-antigen/teichoic acid export membrane protein